MAYEIARVSSYNRGCNRSGIIKISSVPPQNEGLFAEHFAESFGKAVERTICNFPLLSLSLSLSLSAFPPTPDIFGNAAFADACEASTHICKSAFNAGCSIEGLKDG